MLRQRCAQASLIARCHAAPHRAHRAADPRRYDVLRERGHSVFLNPRVLAAGDELTTRLEKALSTSQTGILVWSRETRDSDWVRREYQGMERQATRKKGFRFVPVKLDTDC
jgi:hypothetical protein